MNSLATDMALSEINDQALMARVRALAREERDVIAALIAHLGEVDHRRLYVAAGHPSLFDYCTRGLGLSEGEAFKRTQAARLCRRFPQVLCALAAGRVHLSGVGVLAPHLDEDNVDGLLEAASGRTRRELEALVQARIRHPAAASTPSPPAPAQPTLDFSRDAEPSRTPLPVEPIPPPPPRPVDGRPKAPPDDRRGAGPERSSAATPRPMTIRATTSFRSKLEKARALLSRSAGGRDTEAILERALGELVERLERARFGAPKATTGGNGPDPALGQPGARVPEGAAAHPVAASRPKRTRGALPARTRRAVYERDGGQCTFTGPEGHRCGSTFALDFHHRRAWAHGGSDDAANITLHCRLHNQFEAEREGLYRPAPG